MIFSLLGGLTGSKIPIKMIVIGVVVAVVAGIFFYQKYTISSLREEIRNLEREITIKETAISLLENELKKKEENIKEILVELQKNKMIVNESMKRLEEATTKLQDFERRTRLKNLLNSRKKELILNYINKDIKCWIENFKNEDGECIGGKWVEKK